MQHIHFFIAGSLLVLITSCEVLVNNPDYGNNPTRTETPQRIAYRTSALFPFQNNTNWWMYSEAGGNTLRIAVTDTISDDNILYYRVSFQENRVDTTDDWFQQTSRGTLFGPSLTGSYHQFLPAVIDAATDTFPANGSTVTYHWYESLTTDAGHFRNSVRLCYSSPIIHGFDEIILADSIGIVHLTDFDGRWTVDYSLDSCSINGTVRYFKGL